MEEYNKSREENGRIITTGERTFPDNKVKIIYKKDGRICLKINGNEIGFIRGYNLEHQCQSIQSINFDMYCECEIEVEK